MGTLSARFQKRKSEIYSKLKNSDKTGSLNGCMEGQSRKGLGIKGILLRKRDMSLKMRAPER